MTKVLPSVFLRVWSSQLVSPSSNLVFTVIRINKPRGTQICANSFNISLLVTRDDVSDGNDVGVRYSVSFRVPHCKPSKLIHLFGSLVCSSLVTTQSL